MTIRPIAFLPLSAPNIVKIPFQVPEHDQIKQPIIVEINPRGTGRPTCAADACPFGNIGKSTVAIIVIKLVSTIRGNVQIFVAVVIAIANRNSHAVT